MEKFPCLPSLEPIRSKMLSTRRSTAEPHGHQSTVFCDLMSSKDELYLTVDPRKQRLPLHSCCMTFAVAPVAPCRAVLGMGLSSPGHTLIVAPENTSNWGPGPGDNMPSRVKGRTLPHLSSALDFRVLSTTQC